LIYAGITSYRGFKKTGVAPGQWIAISGIGGLGPLAEPCAKAMGLQVCVVYFDEDKLADATRLGADAFVNAKNDDATAAVQKHPGGGERGVLITVPSLGAFRQGVAMTRTLGPCVFVGLPRAELPTPLFDVVPNCVKIRGSCVGNRHDMTEALVYAAGGKVKADFELQSLSAINQVFARLATGDAPSRVVLNFASR
jgi:propanol-preferring alcohol dehydrogenase